MLLTKIVDVILHSGNISYYENLNYEIPKYRDINNTLRVKRGTIIKVRIEDLQKGSTVKILVKCDCVNCKNPYLKPISMQNYLRCVKEDGKYYCVKCASTQRIKNGQITKLKNGKSFEQWCIDNNYKDILDRWDYELNDDIKPSEICFSAHKKYYFKCPRGIHESELNSINNFTSGTKGIMNCNKCNSFAQYGIDNLGEDFLDKYWDYNKNTISPWDIDKFSAKYIYIYCQKIDYHGSSEIKCATFFANNVRCSYCGNHKVHKLDSIGTLYPKSLEVWSSKNKKSPYEYSHGSDQEVYWKCPEGKHEDYPRGIIQSNNANFRCPECQYSKGEESISNYFISKEFIKIDQYDFIKLINEDKYNCLYYIPQKEFNKLKGLGNGLLSYDFYLPKYNLLIEYQGIQHEKFTPGLHKTIKDFEKQQEHDRRKREYAKLHNMNLLEIWYYDFDNIETILENELIL